MSRTASATMQDMLSPKTISSAALQKALALYPSLVERVYKAKLKDPKKIPDALARDQWRFETLPRQVQPGSREEKNKTDANGGGLTKAAVERLVQWKITNGHSRPFLPAMIRKNEAASVETQTSLAFAKLLATRSASIVPSTATIIAALDLVCKLTGVGPATGTLILTIADPIHVPFFQDEMFAWLFPDAKSDKLKYSQKEYLQLLEAVGPVLQRLDISAVDLEKATYVIGHADLLTDAEREELRHAPEGCVASVAKERQTSAGEGAERQNKTATTAKARQKRSAANDADMKQTQNARRKAPRKA